MSPSCTFALVLLVFAALPSAQLLNQELEGTWTTKSGAVLTGPGFYDPLKDRFTEPNLTGISYSFTTSGFYESAYFRSISNPKKPACPSAMLQFQHGTILEASNGSLFLTPFRADGRQLFSDPCAASTALLTKYNQSEFMQSYQVYTDTYNGRLRLDLFAWDGARMNAMWLAKRPPVMLPTQRFATVKELGGPKRKRSLKGKDMGMMRVAERVGGVVDAAKVFWIGVGLTGVGSVLFLCF